MNQKLFANGYSFSAVIRPKVKLTIKPMINTTIETNHIVILVGKPGNTAKSDPITKPIISAKVIKVWCDKKY